MHPTTLDPDSSPSGRERSLLVNRYSIVLLLAAALLLSGCREEAKTPSSGPESSSENLTKVTLQLNWYPEAEHGGYYAALVHGYFAEEGLEVEIRPGGPGAPVIKLVDQGKSTFGVTNADDVLLQNAQGTEAVALMAPIQTSPRCIMVHKSLGIKSLNELKNVTLAMNSGKPFAMFLKKKLPLPGVKVVDGASIPKFLDDKHYTQQGYAFSEPYLAQSQGGDPQSLLVSELGFNPYTSILIATSQTVESQPEVTRKLVRASIRGWEKYLSEPEETNKRINELNPEMKPDVLEFGVETLRLLCERPEGGRFGGMTDERWTTLYDQMVDIETIKVGAVDVKNAYTLEFLKSDESNPPMTKDE